ncbi:MAG: Sensor protein of zinc sigma-54-dependent two-component system [Myxococcales bacterium]|nr:Sensor protein of zinc sigma-54-dependent two-component system [Myxococcales bacterium]
MRGWTGVVLLGVLVALAGVIWLATVLVGQSRARVVDEFLAQERVHVEDSARTIEADLNDVLEDLHFAVQWLKVEPAEAVRPQLRAMLDIGHPYQGIVVLDGDGRLAAELEDRPETRRYLPALREAARAALGRPAGTIATVRVEDDTRGWLRAFTLPFAAGERTGAIGLLVDTESFFRALPSDEGLQTLALDGHGRPLPATSPGLRAAIEHPAPALARLIASMRNDGAGTIRWSDSEAAGVLPGLGETVVTVAPLHLHGAPRWAFAVLTPIDAIATHERTLVWRIALTAAAIASCLLGLGAYLMITARRGAALQERLVHAQRLAHLHEKTEKIVDNIPAAVLVLSKEGRVTALNRAFRDRSDGELIGAPWERAFPHATAAARQRLAALVDEARASGGVVSLPGATLALFGADGRYSVHAVPLEPRFAESQLLLVIEDLSELRALEDQLLRAEKLATVGVLAAGIAHEIGTPLGIVRGRAEYIRGKLGEHAQNPGLGVIIEQIDLISRTIRQLLDFSRVRPPTVRAVRLPLLARAVADLLRFEGERRKVQLTVEMDELLPALDADPDQLQQVLVNLVMNAYDASHPGGQVTIRAAGDAKRADRLRIEVRDDGSGILPEHRNQIFDPFFTTKKRGQGTGLGLTLCAQIARDHGGQIEVDSEVGRGTTVTLSWPRAHEEGHGASETNHSDR